jgi:hypothetical protein
VSKAQESCRPFSSSSELRFWSSQDGVQGPSRSE